jgi:hypothetical protein
MAVLGFLQTAPSGEYVVSNELAATAFGLLAGVGGGLAQLIAGQRLSKRNDGTIPLRTLAVPVGLSIAGTIAGAVLVPSGGV